MINVTMKNRTIQVESHTAIIELVKKYRDEYDHDIILAKVDGRLTEVSKSLTKDCDLEFITLADQIGNECYRRSVTFVMLKAIYKIVGPINIDKVSVNYSISSGLYCTVKGRVEINDEFIERVQTEMERIVERNIDIEKNSMRTTEAIDLFKGYGMTDKVKLLKYRRSSHVNVYNLGGFKDYFYGYMSYATGILKYFKLYKYDDGFVLQMPTKDNPEIVPEFKPQKNTFNAFKASQEWSEKMNVSTIGYVNSRITDESINDIMMIEEAFQEKQIADIASDIASKGVKFVLIAGPSSSGKTSFSHRLSIQLMAQGLNPHPISVDNYFVDRVDNPVDEDGKLDYEVIEAVDTELFNKDMKMLLDGEEISKKQYNFDAGVRELSGEKLKLADDDILVIEGIHCLNEKMSYALPKEHKYKIYISALTTLNIDEHNRISTSDWRLLRRLVRDLRTRGKSAQTTMEMWYRVRRGEEKNIYPYQDEADAVFNSAMVYEPSVLKVYAEPALFSVPEDSPEFIEANRLLKFLDYVLPLPKDDIPKNSLVREFVGGSALIKE